MDQVFSRWIDHQFKLKENGTDITNEIIAGLTTFTTMAYVLALVPKMMGEAGLPAGQILTAMVFMVFLTTAAMGLYTNRPFVLAPGMGSVAIFSITLVQLQKVPVEIASGIVFLSGCLFVLVTVFGVREAIITIIPKGIKISISAGVGLFLAVIGLRNAKIIIASTEKTALSFGNLAQPIAILATIGFLILLVLEVRKVRGGALIAIVLTTILGIPMGITKIPQTIFSMPSGIHDVFFRFDLMGALDVQYVPFLFAFFLPDFFSSFGTALGVGSKAGFLDKNGDLPEINKVFWIDSLAATLGSLFTIPVLITYLESGAGVEAGGRTGLTALTTASAFLLVLAITPLALMIPAAATAPILVYVGISMLAGMRNLDYDDIAEYLPAFLCIAFTAFTFNIGNGIAVAFIAYVVIKIAARHYQELTLGHYLLALVLMYYFYSLTSLK
ncbi:AGZA family xanthine/uracil permease-like MFS transporter [Sporomusaceae bacterium BoRhaA]|uniref:NCS2 family permease n=1 Tax=Pelorhabdus rhamnosifermentans TaxID=2772457 RepID=UPI001C05F243|nr:NCS2 family permease [Pelorhabdus rhamnosifermentans]MBU2699409.1 AGZA family xanthine/uracil permease-like MFS transporter [Pelorhabdus rhamnosifermentans]